MTKARRTSVEIIFDGVNITTDIEKYLLSISYTDNEEDETDDLQIQLQDRSETWLCKWLNALVTAAAAPSAPAAQEDGWKIGDEVIANGRPQYSSYGNGTPGATVTNHRGFVTYLNLQPGIPYPIHVDYLGWYAESQVQKISPGQDAEQNGAGGKLKIRAAIESLNCGEFELDSIAANGPPATISLKATSLPFSSQIRQTAKTKVWEAYTLSGIAKEMAAANGMACLYEVSSDPYYERAEQYKTSDIEFLQELCHNAGISLKATNRTLVLFDQAAYEAKPPAFTVRHGDGSYTKYKLSAGTADMQYASCRVRYADPITGQVIEGIAYAENYKEDGENNQRLEITAKVSSIAEAQALAAKQLRLHNKYSHTANFTFPGDPSKVAGVTAMLDGWGMWDGKYIIKQAKHSLGNSGYTTQVLFRRVIEGY